MTQRRTLPPKRSHAVFNFEHDGLRYTCGVGFFDDGSIGELFLSTDKPGSQAETVARDAAVVASIALQFGTPISVLRHAVTRDDAGAAAGPLGRALDLIDAATYSRGADVG